MVVDMVRDMSMVVDRSRDILGCTVGDTEGNLAQNTVVDTLGDMEDMEDTLVVVGTCLVYTCQSNVVAASLDSWGGIWCHTFVHIWDHNS